MSDNSQPRIAKPGAPPGSRRTPFMIEEENRQIIQFIRAGASDKQIMHTLGLTWRNYQKRRRMIEKQDMNNTIASLTPEARASTMQRLIETMQDLRNQANQILNSPSTSARDRIEVLKFILSIAEDEYSTKELGPLRFITFTNASLGRQYQAKALEYRRAIGDPGLEEPRKQPDPNAVF